MHKSSVGKLCLLVSMVLLTGTASLAQDKTVDDYVMPTPNAASLGKYVDMPANYHTGAAQISVPVHQIQNGPVSVPIALSYNSSGIRVAETASWVGLGWSLQAGGMISRTVRGAPDEGKNFVNGRAVTGYYEGYGMDLPVLFDYFDQIPISIQGAALPLEDSYNFYAASKGEVDTEPDLFFISAPGLSGTFFFDQQRVPHFVEKKDYKIVVDYSPRGTNGTEPGKFNSFTIVNEQGIRYTFGGTDSNGTEAVDIQEPAKYGSHIPGAYNLSSWYLTKIETLDTNHQVRFEYETEAYSYANLGSQYGTILGEACVPINGSLAFDNGNIIMTKVNGVHLSQIKSNETTVDFLVTKGREDLSGYGYIANPGQNGSAARLDAIEVATDYTCKRFDLTYHYQTSAVGPITWSINPAVDHDRKRLILDQVQESSCGGTVTIPPTVFTYYTTHKLPRRLSFNQDHWGYYNNAGNDLTGGLIATFQTEVQTCEMSNRESSYPAMQANALTRVDYPTGGYLDMSLEANQFVDYWTEDVQHSITSGVQVGNPSATNSIPAEYPAAGQNAVEFTVEAGKEYFVEFTYIWNSSQSLAGEGYVYMAPSPGSFGAVFDGKQISAGDTNPYNNVLPLSVSPGTYKIKLSATRGMAQARVYWIERDVQRQGTRLVGGVRLQSSKLYESAADTRPLTQTIEYLSAKLVGTPFYRQQLKDIFNKLGFSCGGYNVYRISSGNLLPMQSTQGAHIGYDQVRVSRPGYGYSEYAFRVVTDSFEEYQLKELFPMPYRKHQYGQGEPTTERHYATDGTLLSFTRFIYERQLTQVPTQILLFGLSPRPDFCGNTRIYASNEVLRWIDAQLYEGYSRLVKKTTETYQTDGTQLSEQETFYDNPHMQLPTRQSSLLSDGSIQSSLTKYTQDFAYGDCESISSTYSTDFEVASGACWNTFMQDYNACLIQVNYPANPDGADISNLDNCLEGKNSYNAIHSCAGTAQSNFISSKTGFQQLVNNCRVGEYNQADADLQQLKSMVDDNHIAYPVEISQFLQKPDESQARLTASMHLRYSQVAGGHQLNSIEQLPLTAPVSNFTGVQEVEDPGNQTLGYEVNSAYEPRISFSYDAQGNLSQRQADGGQAQSLIWVAGAGYPIAKAINATAAQTFHTSFEYGGGTLGLAKTGRRYHNSGSYTIPTAERPSGTGLVMTYWYYEGGSWKFQDETPYSPTISKAGATRLDEIRVYPKGAMMTTFTFDPLRGLYTATDPNNQVQTYDYDAFGRLTGIRDHRGDLRSAMEYHYK